MPKFDIQKAIDAGWSTEQISRKLGLDVQKAFGLGYHSIQELQNDLDSQGITETDSKTPQPTRDENTIAISPMSDTALDVPPTSFVPTEQQENREARTGTLGDTRDRSEIDSDISAAFGRMEDKRIKEARKTERKAAHTGLSGAYRELLKNMVPALRLLEGFDKGSDYLEATSKGTAKGTVVMPGQAVGTAVRMTGHSFKNVMMDIETRPEDNLSKLTKDPMQQLRMMTMNQRRAVNAKAKELRESMPSDKAFKEAIRLTLSKEDEEKAKATEESKKKWTPIAEKLEEVGKTSEDYFKEIDKTLGMSGVSDRSAWNSPKETIGSGLWWVYNGTSTASNMALTSILPASATYKGIKGIKTLGQLGPQAWNRIARVGAAVAGGGSGASMESTGTYSELRDKGASHEEAMTASKVMFGMVTALNAVSLDQFMRKAGTTMLAKLGRRGMTGLIEAATESVEEPAQVAAQLWAKYVTGQPMPDNVKDMFVQSLKDTADVAPVSFALGLVGGGNVSQNQAALRLDEVRNAEEKHGKFSEVAQMQRQQLIEELANDPTLAKEMETAITDGSSSKYVEDRAPMSDDANRLINKADQILTDAQAVTEADDNSLAELVAASHFAKQGDVDALAYLHDNFKGLEGVHMPEELTTTQEAQEARESVPEITEEEQEIETVEQLLDTAHEMGATGQELDIAELQDRVGAELDQGTIKEIQAAFDDGVQMKGELDATGIREDEGQILKGLRGTGTVAESSIETSAKESSAGMELGEAGKERAAIKQSDRVIDSVVEASKDLEMTTKFIEKYDNTPLAERSEEDQELVEQAHELKDRAKHIEAIQDHMDVVAPAVSQDRRREGRGTDRRVNMELRKILENKTPQEKEDLLMRTLHSETTGLPNKVAWALIPQGKKKVMADLDGLKMGNDLFNHEAGDAMLAHTGEAMRRNAEKPSHHSGDEFAASGDDSQDLRDQMDRANKWLQDNPLDHTVSDGRRFKVKLSFSYGVGDSLNDAEVGMHEHKSRREAAGERVPRGHMLPGMQVWDKDGNDITQQEAERFKSLIEEEDRKLAEARRKKRAEERAKKQRALKRAAKKEEKVKAEISRREEILKEIAKTLPPSGVLTEKDLDKAEDTLAKYDDKAQEVETIPYKHRGKVQDTNVVEPGKAVVGNKERNVYEATEVDKDKLKVIYESGTDASGVPITRQATIDTTKMVTAPKLVKETPIEKIKNEFNKIYKSGGERGSVDVTPVADMISRLGELPQDFKAYREVMANVNKDNATNFTKAEIAVMSPQHLYRKHPAAYKVFEIANEQSDLYNVNYNILTETKDGNSLPATMQRFKKTARKEFKKTSNYLLEKDRNQDGLRLFENESGSEFIVKDRDDKVLLNTPSEQKAETYILEQEMKEMDKLGFSAEAQEFVLAFRKMTMNGYRAFATPIRKVIAEAKAKGVELKPVKVNTDKGIIKVSLQSALTEMGSHRGYYYPRNRKKAQWVVTAKKDGVNPERHHHTTAAQATLHKRRLEKDGYKADVLKDKQLQNDAFADISGSLSLDAVINNALAGIESGQGDINTRVQFAEALMDNLAAQFRVRGARSNLMKRRDLKGKDVWVGYDENPITSAVQYVNSIAAGNAKRDTAEKMFKAFTGTTLSYAEFKKRADDAGIKANEQDYNDLVNERRIDAKREPNTYSDVKDYMQEMMRGNETTDRVVQQLKAFAAFKFMSGKLSSAVINMTNQAFGVPAAALIVAGIKINKMLRSVAAGNLQYANYITRGKKVSDPWSQRAMEELTMKGWDDAKLNKEAFQILNTAEKNIFNFIFEKLMIPFAVTEKMNRAATIIGAYNAQMDRHTGPMTEEIHNDFMRKAKDISDLAHGIYGKVNLPAWARGSGIAPNVGRMFYMFKTFQHGYLQMMKKAGFKIGSFKVGDGNNKAFLYAAMAPAILTGLQGSAMAALLFSAIKLLTGEDPEEGLYNFIEEELGTTAGDLARTGSAGLGGHGIDLRGSMSMDFGLPTNLKDMFGAPGAFVTDIGYGMQEIKKGNTYKGVEKMMPSHAVSNVMKAWREKNEGLTRKNNAPVMFEGKRVKLTTTEAIVRALSFNPARISIIREKDFAGETSDQRMSKWSSDITNRYTRFLLTPANDRTNAQRLKIVTEIQAYNHRIKNLSKRGLTTKPFITSKSLTRNVMQRFKPAKRSMIRKFVLSK